MIQMQCISGSETGGRMCTQLLQRVTCSAPLLMTAVTQGGLVQHAQAWLGLYRSVLKLKLHIGHLAGAATVS